MVAILDADKEGFLRSESSLIQTIGRAARHSNGHVIMYADVITSSIRTAIDETYRRREIQEAHNVKNGIIPQGIHKTVRDITERVKAVAAQDPSREPERRLMSESELFGVVKDLEAQMKLAAKKLEFEKAAMLRDEIRDIRRLLAIGGNRT